MQIYKTQKHHLPTYSWLLCPTKILLASPALPCLPRYSWLPSPSGALKDRYLSIGKLLEVCPSSQSLQISNTLMHTDCINHRVTFPVNCPRQNKTMKRLQDGSQVKTLAAKPDNPKFRLPAPTCWKERTSSQKLSSGPPTHAVASACPTSMNKKKSTLD